MSDYSASAAGRHFGCPNCGGGLRYDIVTEKMICDRCGAATELSQIADAPAAEDMIEVTEYHCPQCGAMVYSTDTSATGFCSFCGSDVILEGRLGKTRRPAAIVPFRITREDCEAHYREHLKHYHLMPKELKSAETISHFRPVYVPFWSYDVKSSGVATLKGHKSYTKGHYQYTEEYKLSMHADIDQKNILYDASTAFEDETAAMLQHTAADAKPFHSAYLSGFYAQAADVPAETYEDEAAAAAVRIFMDRVKEEYEMDSVEMTGNIRHAFGLPDAQFKKKLVMLPVWLLAHRQGARVIYTAVNGCDGRVVCDVPVSNPRISGVIAGIAVLLFLLLNRLLTMKPDLLMVACAMLLMITQLIFSSAQTALNNRRTRAFEPDFTGESPSFVGPAQQLLTRKKNSIASSGGVMKKALGNIGSVLSILFIVLFLLSSGDDSALSGMFSLRGAQGRTILTAVMGVMLIIMVIYTVVRISRGNSGPKLPRILSCAACAAGVLFLFLGLAEDILYYGCAALMLAAVIWELLSITRAHNEYASRPVPFFKEESAV